MPTEVIEKEKMDRFMAYVRNYYGMPEPSQDPTIIRLGKEAAEAIDTYGLPEELLKRSPWGPVYDETLWK